jgi:hypothetical protein
MTSRNGEPLRIRALLRSGVICDRFLPLDAVLHYQAYREKYGDQVITLPGEYSSAGEVDLPFGKVSYAPRDRNPGGFYYQCSWAQWPEHMIEARDYWNKRFDVGFADLIDFAGKRGKVLVEEGHYKAYHAVFFYRSALWVDWYCVGDKARIEWLLATVTHIGKKIAQGWGRVIEWDVQPADDDYSVWMGDRLMRGVPPDHAPGYPTGMYGIRPSYWHRSNQMLLALPR